MKKVEYSQIVRRKLKDLRMHLTAEFGPEVSRKSIKQVTDAARGLGNFEGKGRFYVQVIWNFYDIPVIN